MKLHRLVLENYRGIEHRDIEFPDHGVVVVSGANEIGKSSMIEALDLLLESKDRSTKKEVKQVKPTDADVGSEVTAEISTGPYRFIYRKRFNKKCETQLTVLEPRREAHSGDEAHDRVQAMLAETVDTELWHAQRVLQSASTAAVDLSGCDALTRALDVAAGDSAALSGTEPLLIEKIDAEFGRYFTPTGRRATGEWADAIVALRAAEEEVQRCAAAVAEVDDRVNRHATLTAELAELSPLQKVATVRQTAAQAAADTITQLTEQVKEAELIAAAATATSTSSQGAHVERQRLRAETDTRAATVASLAAQTDEAAEAQATAQGVTEAADAVVDEVNKLLAAAQQRADNARRIVDELARRDEADRLTARLGKIDAAQCDRDAVSNELSAIALTDNLFQQIERAGATVERVEGQLALVSGTIEFVAASDIELVVADQRMSLPAGQSWSTTAGGTTEVEVPGVLTARFTPGATALDIQAEHAAAQQDLTAALAMAQVADVAAARLTDQRRRELLNSRDQLTATLAALCGDDDVEQLRERLAGLRAKTHTGDIAMDATAARVELDEAGAARVKAAADLETHRKVAAAAVAKLTELSTQATLSSGKLATQRAELAAVADRLAQLPATATDETLEATAAKDLQVAQQADGRVAELKERLAAAAPDTVAAELVDATTAAAALKTRHDRIAGTLREISVELTIFGSQGRKGKLDAAETALGHARGEHTRVGSRARAVELLKSVMVRHRDNTRLRYVEPFRAELERLGRPVFGPSFEVGIDTDLCILNRTLDGCTVPYESLSGGAKEQLGILARLAGAALVAKEDAVPILIDDALGFTDPERLAKMAEVFDTLGERGQVIVLTCTPARYDGVKGAQRIELCA
ncbi:MAG TPA: AAA family ATPase [Mycobacterium sp.]